ncbi:dimethylarginine dimethylaminohydrolase family protein [Legionella bononiensis]|uniref:N(G),N(G)-dimethylarginine dimethylaminohydrolase n=1 Tax=Legionella bononiensis TaxID=2793102 RepID=A0ABS1WCP0_9GAMM|nr:arginine deiminase family protein [Legionella bononiensis]MBL7478893.1 N(G),N(G)-dimethylarginine dimethylaminohydrolase [Legionella bononiensis]MBL7527025.1 N(G),N(G)-dimethylarginine dimethylaminohydrolase [Legionella bononiensis]MBL7562382.1 N(G),N(G)-dimethylarginine dimethylaminohydrolase [Legionella bononiensis]
MFHNAIVRTPSASLIHGLTTSATLGVPDYELALIQHQNYINALAQCGLEVTVLPPIDHLPDSCFVEDVALLTHQTAFLTRPGAVSRQGEVKEIEQTINAFYKSASVRIEAPGTLEAGDILNVNNHFYIGLSARTNKDGASQMIHELTQRGYSASTIQLTEFLHLKTGVSYLDQGYLLVSGELVNHPAFNHLKQIIIDPDESYAANCIMINGTVLLAQGYPKTKEQIHALGFPCIELDVSEFKKIDGGLSCLSLRF